jgi:hypothetical protein
MRRRLAATVLAAALGLASTGAAGTGGLGEDPEATTRPASPPAAECPLVRLDAGDGGARALPRADRGTTTTYAYLEREGAGAFVRRARDPGSGASPLAEAPAATGYAVVPGSAAPGRASPIPAIAVLFASTLGGLGVLLRRQWTGRREA